MDDKIINEYKDRGYNIIGDIKLPEHFPTHDKLIDILFSWDGFLTTIRGYFHKYTFLSERKYEAIKDKSDWNPEDDKDIKIFCTVKGNYYSDSNFNNIANVYKIYQGMSDSIIGWRYVDVEGEKLIENKNYFLSKLRTSKREGIEELIEYLNSTDFFIAPASSKPKYHGCFKGGLLQHSIDVYNILCNRLNSIEWKDKISNSDTSVELISLLHDVCKINFYHPKYKITEYVDELGIKHSRIDESIIEGYIVEDNYPYGHGEKSVDIISNYIKLTEEEKLAIRWHMGPFTGKQDWHNWKSAVKMYPIVLALFEADIESAYF